ncbi:MAG: beta-ketoacyl synthase N-terminal-like domain-containing protein [Gammaproteobacteria bacterium]
MKKAVITGMGAVSCIGNTLQQITQNLIQGNSGIVRNNSYDQLGMRSLISGSINIPLEELIDRKLLRFMSNAAAYAFLATKDALAQAGLSEEDIQSPAVGVIAGSGGASPVAQLAAADIAREKGSKKIGPYAVTKTMGSTVSACLGTAFKTKGINYSITSACSTSAHCLGQATELIQSGKQDIIIAGGAEDEHWTLSTLFDAMGALSSNFNDTPHLASRPFDANRDGFVISGGAGMLIVEEEQHAKKRGANILAEVSGYYANSDGFDMVSPSGEGAQRCMQAALKQHGKKVDYINAHGTSTPVGDIAELIAISKVFNQDCPYISSTKSMTGHSLGATGAQEVIYSLLMMHNNFIAPSINIENEIEEGKSLRIVKESVDANISSFMSNSFGFGGTNASIILQKY